MIKLLPQSLDCRFSKSLRQFKYALILCIVVILGAGSLRAQDQNEKPIELSGFSISQTYDVVDGEKLSLEDPMLIRALYRIKKTSPKSRWEYAQYSKDVSWEDMTNKLEDFRFWVFDRRLRLKTIKQHTFKNADADSEIRKIFICRCETEDGSPCIVIATNVPNDLKSSEVVDEPVQATGFLFSQSLISESENDPIPIFVIDRLAWYPDKPSASVGGDRVRLAQSGMDVGLFDLVERNNTKPLSSNDSEAFFQMIASVGNMEDEGLPTDALNFQQVMQNASKSFGKPVRINGIIRRCSIVKSLDEGIQTRLGLGSYYQLIVFPDLDGKKIVVKSKDGEDDINDRFPVTVCFTHLPEGMSQSDLERKPCLIEGYLFRFWKFQSERTDSKGLSGQVSPLIVCHSPTITAAEEAPLDWILLGFVAAIIGVIAAMFYGFRRSDQQTPSAGKKILEELPDQIDVAGIEASDSSSD